MKKAILPFFLTFLSLSGFSQNQETEVKSEVIEVTVFRNGMQETRIGNATIAMGNSTLKFSNLPNDINPNSIQIKGAESFTILSLSYRINYLENDQPSEEVQKLHDSIEIVTNKLNWIHKKIYVIEQEKKLFTDNRKMVGKDEGLDPDELEEMLLLYSKRLTELETDNMSYKEQEKQWNLRLSKLQNQLNTFHSQLNKGTGEILVDVKSSSKITSKVELSYFLYGGGWYPFYDVRAKDTKSDVEISYKANVRQSTGTDWNNVKMILSSASPNFSNDLPELSSWTLSYLYIQNGKNQNGYYQQTYQWANGDGIGTGTYAYNPGGNSTVKQSAGYEFIINKPYSIPSDGKDYVVEIGKSNVKTTYAYFSIPKMDEAAFILARLTNWYELNLLPGKTNIYLNNSYVGETFLNPEIVEDTLDISLGNDESIVVSRKNVSDMNAKSITGNTRKRTDEYELSFRNNHSYEVVVDVLDQIPVSTDKDIIVSLDNDGNAKYKKENGELSWKINVTPGETVKVRFKYTVKYPKNKIISNF